MKRKAYLFDTHSMVFWDNKEAVSEKFIKFFDKQNQEGNLYVSSISFWEIALLVKKEKIKIEDVYSWKDEILRNTNIKLIDPTVTEMIDSTLLPDHNKDPFDRILIAQAKYNNLLFVTKDPIIQKYDVSVFWI